MKQSRAIYPLRAVYYEKQMFNYALRITHYALETGSAVSSGLEEAEDVAAGSVHLDGKGVQGESQPFVGVEVDLPAVGRVEGLVIGGDEGGHLQAVHQGFIHRGGGDAVDLEVLGADGLHILQDE